MIRKCLENISPALRFSSGALERLTKSRLTQEQVERPTRITASGISGPYIEKKKVLLPVLRNTCTIFSIIRRDGIVCYVSEVIYKKRKSLLNPFDNFLYLCRLVLTTACMYIVSLFS